MTIVSLTLGLWGGGCKHQSSTPAASPPSGASTPAAPSASGARTAATPTPAAPAWPDGLHAVETAGGRDFACARLESGAIHCVGRNIDGTRGVGSPSALPINRVGPAVTGIADAAEIACRLHTCCAVRRTGAVLCWGTRGRIGAGTDLMSNVPVETGITDGEHVVVGGNHSCAIRRGGRVSCWGGNDLGQLGDGTLEARTTVIDVAGLPGPVVQLAASRGATCARQASGAVHCWGTNGSGAMLDARSDAGGVQIPTPVPLAGLADATDITAGGVHFCAVRRGGAVACWGDNQYSQLGAPSSESTHARLVTPAGVTTATHVAAGDVHTCARVASGQVMCWGTNDHGQLGDPAAPAGARATPAAVAGLAGAQAIFQRGEWGTCARNAAGQILCWGSGEGGELGNGTSANSATPVAWLPPQ